ncbi:MAG: sodium-dependent transporter [Oscillospiraceae bacterium]
MKRETWSSRSTFILAAIGSAVGLGNAWRFPGLAAQYGGGSFLMVYLIAMIVLGIPLLMMEIAIGRKMRQGAPGSLSGINKNLEPIGWAATTNAFVVVTYYSAIFAWVLIMVVGSFKFANMTGDTEAASKVFPNIIQTSWQISGHTIPMVCLFGIIVAWTLIYYCIRNGAKSVDAVIKYIVFLPIILLGFMALKGITMSGSAEGLYRLFVPDLSALANVQLWIDAVGQVFFSMSIMMAVMFAYGSFLDKKSNIAVDATIIAFADMSVSLLSGIVMFTTMSGAGMLDNISTSGIATAFIIYPQTIVSLTSIGWLNSLFGVFFYLTLVTLAIDSAFSIVQGVSTAISDKFKLSPNKTTKYVCLTSFIFSLIFVTRAGLAWLDIVDNWTNQYNLILIGVFECIAVGWMFNVEKVREEVNKNTNKFKVPSWWFNISIKYLAPILLIVLFVWNIANLFIKNNGIYGDYPWWANIAGGWMVSAIVLLSGFIIKLIVKRKSKQGFIEESISWEDMNEDSN